MPLSIVFPVWDSLSPVPSDPTGSSLDFLLQEAPHNPFFLPSKGAPLQRSYHHTNLITHLLKIFKGSSLTF